MGERLAIILQKKKMEKNFPKYKRDYMQNYQTHKKMYIITGREYLFISLNSSKYFKYPKCGIKMCDKNVG